MKASTASIADLARRASRLPLAPIAGGLLGAAVAFLCLITPIWMIERLSVQWGLPALLAAATPPLGMKAQLIVAICCGSAAFAFGAATVSLLDRGGKSPSRDRRPTIVEEIVELEEEEPSSARRRTFSPATHDEPERAPRPILAARELGVPMDDIVEDRPLAWARAGEETAPRSATDESWARSARDHDAEDWLDLGAFPIADVVYTPAEQPAHGPIEPVPSPVTASSIRSASMAGAPSISSLMARLEAGLVKRGLAGLNEARNPQGAPSAATRPADMDRALRDALQDLHRVAGRG